MKAAFILILVLVGLSQSSPRERRHPLSPRRRTLTRVSYIENGHHQPSRVERVYSVIRPRKRKRRLRPVEIVPVDSIHPLAGIEGSYAAVSGTPGRGSVHLVENVPSLGDHSVTVVNGVRSISHHHPRRPNLHRVLPPVDHPLLARPVLVQPQHVLPSVVAARERLPLPKCSYINTEFVGDDLRLEDEERRGEGVNAGSARACKARCRLDDRCDFWTYREGIGRDVSTKNCFLKEGNRGERAPREAVPRLGFVSGTKDNNCSCLTSEDEEDEVCPIKDPRGLVYPWRSLSEEENDLEADLARFGPIVGDARALGGDTRLLQAQVIALREQLDLLTGQLGSN